MFRTPEKYDKLEADSGFDHRGQLQIICKGTLYLKCIYILRRISVVPLIIRHVS